MILKHVKAQRPLTAKAAPNVKGDDLDIKIIISKYSVGT